MPADDVQVSDAELSSRQPFAMLEESPHSVGGGRDVGSDRAQETLLRERSQCTLRVAGSSSCVIASPGHGSIADGVKGAHVHPFARSVAAPMIRWSCLKRLLRVSDEPQTGDDRSQTLGALFTNNFCFQQSA